MSVRPLRASSTPLGTAMRFSAARQPRVPAYRAATAPRSTFSTTCTPQTLFETVTAERGFLPAEDPLIRLPGNLDAFEAALQEVPKLALGSPGTLRRALHDLPEFDLQQLSAWSDLDQQQQQQLLMQPPPAGQCYSSQLQQLLPQQQQQQQQHAINSGSSSKYIISNDVELWRAYLVLSFLSHAYMWCDGPDVPQTLPAVLAKPWTHISAAIGMPPVLVYTTYNMMNWRRLDLQKPLELGNLACQHNFFGGMDEEWFRLIHIAIEAAAAPALAALQPLQQAAQQCDSAAMELHLGTVTSVLQEMQQLLAQMGERCDPYIYYKRVRVPMSGWKNNPALPQGLIYEGCWNNEPQQLYGETGAQSAIVPAFDVVLGIQHKKGWLQQYLSAMRLHMPPSHRGFLAQLEAGPSARHALSKLIGHEINLNHNNTALVVSSSSTNHSLLEAYNAAVLELEKFRAQHRGFANSYIAQWSKKEVGTGGSDFMPALARYREATAAHKVLKASGCPLH